MQNRSSQPNVGAVKKSTMSQGAPSNDPMSNQTRSQLGLGKRTGDSVRSRPFGSAARLIGSKGKR